MDIERTPVSELLTRCIDYVSFAGPDTEISERFGHTTYEVTEEDLSRLRSGEVMVLTGTDYVNLVVGKNLVVKDLDQEAEQERQHFKARMSRLEQKCRRCRGFGSLHYGSTSGWLGGMGGASMTRDVCDVCWGSGDEANPFRDLREMRNGLLNEVEAASFRAWAKSTGVGTKVLRSAIPHMVEALKALNRRRKDQLDFWQQRAVEILVTRLEKLNAAAEQEEAP